MLSVDVAMINDDSKATTFACFAHGAKLQPPMSGLWLAADRRRLDMRDD